MMVRVGRLAMICVLLAAVFLTGPAGMPRAAAAPAVTVRLRIGVTADGIVQVTPSDLVGAGVDPAAVDPQTFALSSMGQPVAIQVTDNGDGSFNQDDRVLFFGEKFRGTQFQEKYTDERVYWLESGGEPGLRITELDAEPKYDLPLPSDVAATAHAEIDSFWFPLWTTELVNVTQDTWFWQELQPTGVAPVTANVGYVVPDPAPDSTATFRLTAFAKYSNRAAQPEHRTVVTLNGAPLMDQTWSGRWQRELSVAVPAGQLVSGLNTVEIGAHVTPGNYTDDVLVNYWEVAYRRRFRAWEGQFDFRAETIGTHEYNVGNWASKLVTIWDITDAAQPRSLIGAVPTLVDSKIELRFRTNDVEGARYWLQEASTYQHPATIRSQQDTGLRNSVRGADTVIITPAEFHQAAESLAAWHETHGRRTVVADLQDVYDEFSAGIAIAPEAIPNLLAWASANWPSPAPEYLTLLGDGHYNMKGHNPGLYGTAPSWIPPYLVFADPWLGEVAADTRYGDINGDNLPEVAVGRVTANTATEAQIVVDKITHYDETVRAAAWQRQTMFVADNPDSAGDFPALSDEIIADYLAVDLTVTKAYLPGKIPESPPTADEIAQTKGVILNTLQSGVWLVQYTGHGTPFLWASERILRSTDATGLNNGDRLPVWMVFNCLDGFFIHPFATAQGISELMQRQPDGGVIAAISPTGEGITPDQQAFRRILMTVMFKENVREIGKALDLAKHRYHDQNGAQYLIETMTLFGDPAMRLPLAAAPQHRVYLPAVLR